jgi:hypothetical protein
MRPGIAATKVAALGLETASFTAPVGLVWLDCFFRRSRPMIGRLGQFLRCHPNAFRHALRRRARQLPCACAAGCRGALPHRLKEACAGDCPSWRAPVRGSSLRAVRVAIGPELDTIYLAGVSHGRRPAVATCHGLRGFGAAAPARRRPGDAPTPIHCRGCGRVQGQAQRARPLSHGRGLEKPSGRADLNLRIRPLVPFGRGDERRRNRIRAPLEG